MTSPVIRKARGEGEESTEEEKPKTREAQSSSRSVLKYNNTLFS